MLENTFKTGLVKELKSRFPGCIVLHADPNEIQGIPDLVVLYEDTWAALEGKKSARASHRPNQDYYVEKMNEMSYDVWVAAYRKSMKKPATSYKYGIWQYTDEARIPGVSKNADMSYAYKDYPTIIKRAGLSRVKGA